MQPSKVRELTVIVLHIAFWAQLGVLTRIYLNKFFSDGCKGSWGVCLTSEGLQHRTLGAYFTDLPSNMLGSFVMGLLAAAATIGLGSKKAVAIFGGRHSWQKRPELHIGLRTGYCGSLTTFASWELDLIVPLIGGAGPQGGQWAEFLWGLIIGLELSLASYVFGLQCAVVVDRYLLLGGERETRPLEPGRSPAVRAMEEEERERERAGQEKHGKEGGGFQLMDQAEELAEEGNVELTDDEVARGGSQGLSNGSSHPGGSDLAHHSRPGDAELAQHSNRPGAPGHDDMAEPSTIDLHDTASEAAPNEPCTSSKAQSRPVQSWTARFVREDGKQFELFSKTTLCTAALLTCTTAAWCIFAGLDHKVAHGGRRSQWFALIFAPFGAVVRWLLSGYNSRLPKPLHWFPIGTFVANMIACIIDFVLQAVTAHSSLGYWPLVLLPAVRVGFSGALSTVSTFVAEVHAQLKLLPDSLNGWIYAFVTLATGALLGVIFYGWGSWAS